MTGTLGIRTGQTADTSTSVQEGKQAGLRRTALILLALGALTVVLLALPYKMFELDRFFVPKELGLHLAALLAALCCVVNVRTFELDRADTFLAAFVGLSAVSAVFATNHGLSTRALAVTVTGAAVFWAARAVAGAGYGRPLVIAMVVAVIVGAMTGLLQAYGLESEYASLARAPGGTFGNRNFMAHLCAIGLPALLWLTATARRGWAVTLGAVGTALLGAALVLSRTRAAWVALIACALALAIPLWIVRRRFARTGVSGRIIVALIGATIGVVAALALPNHLNWKSDSPYLDSVRGVVDYSSGSGRGRILQYRNSLRMAIEHPLLGVGPGNWPVHYTKYAKRNDPSLSPTTHRPSNPWPSSDWVAFVTERGIVATLMLVLALFGIVITTWRRPRTPDRDGIPDPEAALAPFAVAGTVVVAITVGMFDAVLLLGAPALIVWTLIGTLSMPGRPRLVFTPPDAVRHRWVVFAAVIGVLFVARGSAQVAAMATSCRSFAFALERCRTIVR